MAYNQFEANPAQGCAPGSGRQKPSTFLYEEVDVRASTLGQGSLELDVPQNVPGQFIGRRVADGPGSLLPSPGIR